MFYSGGIGTESKPYLLSTVQDAIDYFATGGHGSIAVENNYATLINDIDARGSFTSQIPDNASLDFRGNLDLNGYTLTVYHDNSAYWWDELWGTMKNGTIRVDIHDNATTKIAWFDNLTVSSLLENVFFECFSSTSWVPSPWSLLRISDTAVLGAKIIDCIFKVHTSFAGQIQLSITQSNTTMTQANVVNVIFVVVSSGATVIHHPTYEATQKISVVVQGDTDALAKAAGNFVYYQTAQNWTVDGLNWPFYTFAQDPVFEIKGTVYVDGVPSERSVTFSSQDFSESITINSSNINGTYSTLFYPDPLTPFIITYCDDVGNIALTNTPYEIGDRIHPTGTNGYYYICVSAGTSGATLPANPWDGSQNISVGTATFEPHKLNKPDSHGAVYAEVYVP